MKQETIERKQIKKKIKKLRLKKKEIKEFTLRKSLPELYFLFLHNKLLSDHLYSFVINIHIKTREE